MNEYSSYHYFPSISIIGLGLIGGSFARLAREKFSNIEIFAFDTHFETLESAISEGVITDALSSLSDPRLFSSSLIVLGVHLSKSEAILSEITRHAAYPLSIMDLGSAKRHICQVADGIPYDFTFIGGHPLAGREVSGYENGRWDLFLDKPFLLTPCQKTSLEFQERIISWLQGLDVLPIVLEQDHHDYLMSIVSHFPQFYAVALAGLLKQYHPDEILRFLGGGIDDQMRLMASPYAMWRDVFQFNKEKLNTVLVEFIHLLTEMQQALMNDNLAPYFEDSQLVYQLYQLYKSR